MNNDAIENALDDIPAQLPPMPEVVEILEVPESTPVEEDTEELLEKQRKSIQEDVKREDFGEGKRRINDEGDMWTFLCPHCNQYTEVLKQHVNCRIFRHAVFIHNGQPINPHMPKEQCDMLVANNQVYGCAKPIRFQFTPQGNYVEICDYI